MGCDGIEGSSSFYDISFDVKWYVVPFETSDVDTESPSVIPDWYIGIGFLRFKLWLDNHVSKNSCDCCRHFCKERLFCQFVSIFKCCRIGFPIFTVSACFGKPGQC